MRVLLSLCLIAIVIPLAARADQEACQEALRPKNIRLGVDDFSRIFHGILAHASVTSLRQELKTVVLSADGADFLERTKAKSGLRISLRDTPEEPGSEFVTNTDYLPSVQGRDATGHQTFGGVIRIRDYFIVPRGTLVQQLRQLLNLPRSRIAEGDADYAKLEFKIGHPDDENPGQDLDGVVDKPGLVLEKADIAALFSSRESFEAARTGVAARAKALRLKGQLVNSDEEVDEVLARIALLHEKAAGTLKPVWNIRYRREAYRIVFEDSKGQPVEIQLTFDRNIEVTDLATGERFPYGLGEEVIELKIPLAYARLSDQALGDLGLGELAELRADYFALKEAPGTRRGSGKRARGSYQLGQLGSVGAAGSKEGQN
jgi:hypothetical protein